MKLVLLLCFILTCEAQIKELKEELKRDAGLHKKVITEGVEFSKLTRSALLRVLSAFEESIHKHLKKKKLKPIFTAQFANSRFTRPFIYPNVFQAKKDKKFYHANLN